ncbi:hypothetical protein MY10362_003748 [Beauveria mimosiformis]
MFLHGQFNFASTAASLATKVLVQQAIYTPIFNTYFFAAQSLLSGASVEDTWIRLQLALPTSIVTGWKVWSGVALVSFMYVPAQFRSVFSGPDTFRAALKQHKVVVADFHALWCGDCKMIDPFFKKYGDAPTTNLSHAQTKPRGLPSKPPTPRSLPRHDPVPLPTAVVDSISRHAADEKFKDVYFCKIDVDVLQGLSKEYNVRRMPTFILFKDGNRLDDVFEPKPPQLDAFLAKAL